MPKHPHRLDDQPWLAFVEAACRLHREQGRRRLLVATTAEDDADLRALLATVGADEHVVVRLEAEPATLRQRIVARAPENWSGLDELVATAARLAPRDRRPGRHRARSAPKASDPAVHRPDP